MKERISVYDETLSEQADIIALAEELVEATDNLCSSFQRVNHESPTLINLRDVENYVICKKLINKYNGV